MAPYRSTSAFWKVGAVNAGAKIEIRVIISAEGVGIGTSVSIGAWSLLS
jgi:hypothetical protein